MDGRSTTTRIAAAVVVTAAALKAAAAAAFAVAASAFGEQMLVVCSQIDLLISQHARYVPSVRTFSGFSVPELRCHAWIGSKPSKLR